jgi:hypothetical protein
MSVAELPHWYRIGIGILVRIGVIIKRYLYLGGGGWCILDVFCIMYAHVHGTRVRTLCRIVPCFCICVCDFSQA